MPWLRAHSLAVFRASCVGGIRCSAQMPSRGRSLAAAAAGGSRSPRTRIATGETVHGEPVGHQGLAAVTPTARSSPSTPTWHSPTPRQSPPARSADRHAGRAAAGRGALTLRAAAERVASELGLSPSLSVRDVVASARAELNLPDTEPRGVKASLLEVCTQLEIETGWDDGDETTDRGALRLSPTTTRSASPPALRAGSPSSAASHQHEQWFTQRGFSPTRSPRRSPARDGRRSTSPSQHVPGRAGTRWLSAHGARSVSVAVSGDVRGLSLAVVSSELSSDVERPGSSPLPGMSAEADAWHLSLHAATRAAAFYEIGQACAQQDHLEDTSSGGGGGSAGHLVSSQMKQHLESSTHLLSKDSASHTKETLRATLDLEASAARQGCDSLAVVLFESSLCTAPDVANSQGRPVLERTAQRSVSPNGCGGNMVEMTYSTLPSHDATTEAGDTGRVISPYRGGLRVGGGFKHLPPPPIKTLQERLHAKEITVTVQTRAGGTILETFSDAPCLTNVVDGMHWSGAVIGYARRRDAWDATLKRVRNRREGPCALAIQAACRQMLERNQFLAHRYLREGQQHMRSLRWERAVESLRGGLGLRCVHSLQPPSRLTIELRQGLQFAELSWRRRDLARETCHRLLLEGNAYVEAQDYARANQAYEAALAVEGVEDEALQAKLQVRLAVLDGQAAAEAAQAQARAAQQAEATRQHAREWLVVGAECLRRGDISRGTEAFAEAMQLAIMLDSQHLQGQQQQQGGTELPSPPPLRHEVRRALADAQQTLADLAARSGAEPRQLSATLHR